MQNRCTTALLVASVTLGVPSALAEGGLYERNYGFLLALVPDGGVLEVQLVEDGQLVTQLWTAEQFASFRAAHAAAMGIDYAARLEGVPAGPGDIQCVGMVAGDTWGASLRTNTAIPRGLPRTIAVENEKLWLFGGAGAQTGIYELSGAFALSAVFCPSYPQATYPVTQCWIAGTGFMFNFGFPFGSLFWLTGAALCETA